jgi:hypothetical protein
VTFAWIVRSIPPTRKGQSRCQILKGKEAYDSQHCKQHRQVGPIRGGAKRMPPDTHEESPPAARRTGADSPVTALSFTVAEPIISSSAGIVSLAPTSTTPPRGEHTRFNSVVGSAISVEEPLRMPVPCIDKIQAARALAGPRRWLRRSLQPRLSAQAPG